MLRKAAPTTHSVGYVRQGHCQLYNLRKEIFPKRHTYATLSLDSSITPKIVSARIDHSNLSVTFQVYGHRSTGHDREATELVAKLICEALALSSDQ